MHRFLKCLYSPIQVKKRGWQFCNKITKKTNIKIDIKAIRHMCNNSSIFALYFSSWDCLKKHKSSLWFCSFYSYGCGFLQRVSFVLTGKAHVLLPSLPSPLALLTSLGLWFICLPNFLSHFTSPSSTSLPLYKYWRLWIIESLLSDYIFEEKQKKISIWKMSYF